MSAKKSAKAQKQEATYEVSDLVLGKVRGYSPWPARVVDPETVPPNVKRERPSNKSSKFYCVQFFPSGDYSWLVPKDMSKLQRHEIDAYIAEPYRKSTELLQAYRIALDPKAWEEELAAAEDAADADVDQLESENEAEGDDDDEGESKPKKTKKRKRESETAPGKVGSKTKGGVKAKKEKDSAEKEKKISMGKGRKSGNKSKNMVESEEDADGVEDDTSPGKGASPPPGKKSKRDKDEDASDPEALKVRDWRHKLQKIFLSDKAPPKEEDMPGMDQLFSTVESYDKISIQYLSFSKIGKVMRHIAALAPEKVPKDDEYRFRERAKALVDKWHLILKPNGEANGVKMAPMETEPLSAVQADMNGDTSIMADAVMSEA